MRRVADVAYTKGKHNAKFGVQASHKFLTEAFQFGITDPAFNDPANDSFLPGLAPYDLTRGGSLFTFNGHTDVKQVAAYAQDAISLGNLALNLGVRFDNYAGISSDHLWQPRLFKEVVSSLTERRMTMELSMTIAIGAAPAIAEINPLLAAFIHVTSEPAFILNSARLLPGAIAPDQDSDSRRRAASA